MKKVILLVLTLCLSLSCGTAGLLLIQGSDKSDVTHNVNTPQAATMSTVIADSGMSKCIASVPMDSYLSIQGHFEEEAIIESNPQLDYGFELPVKGATGYGVIAMNLHPELNPKGGRDAIIGYYQTSPDEWEKTYKYPVKRYQYSACDGIIKACLKEEGRWPLD